MLKRILAIAFLTFAIAAPAAAQFTSSVPLPAISSASQPVSVGVTPPGTPVLVTPKTDYTFETGDFVASLVNWLYVAFGGLVVTIITTLGMKALTWFGVQTTDQMRTQLQEVVTNGLNAAAGKAQAAAKGADWNVAIKNQVVADTIAYTQSHADETIKALGLDPKSGKAVEAIKARIETAIVDDAQPTNPNVQPGITSAKA